MTVSHDPKNDLTYTYDSETRDAFVTALEEAEIALRKASSDALFQRSYDKAKKLEDDADTMKAALEAIDRAEQA